jgi:peptidoglycan/LPS O-acetylase OafA/YrhL
MRYRAEIDGLRAIAVLMVMFFHFDIGLMSGGFVGVDIFFVISGYLITNIVFTDLKSSKFSLAVFYERRARRIFPVLFAVLIASWGAASVLLIDSDMIDFSWSVIYTVFFSTNILFAKDSGYFDAPAETKPLLHTWSLGVEEQFYIIFPVLLYVLHRYWPRRLRAVVIVICLLSLVESSWLAIESPKVAFYMLPSRFWELCLGALLALGCFPSIRNRETAEAVSLVGLAAIFGSVVTYSKAMVFPGMSALVPCVGAAMIIHADIPDGLASRLLSARPLRFIGLISYSLYMWHWPIIVFLGFVFLDKPSGAQSVMAILASVAVAAMSWRYIEQPVRNRSIVGRVALFSTSSAAMAAMIAAGALGIAAQGWAGRLSPLARAMAASASDFSPRRKECHSGENRIVPPLAPCVYGAKAPPTVAIWGDSHAVELAFALGEVANAHGRSLAHFSYSACPPALEFAPARRSGCSNWNSQVIDAIRSMPQIETVILIAFYTSSHYNNSAIMPGIERTVQQLLLMNRHVVMVYPIPTPSANVPILLARAVAVRSAPDKISISERQYLDQNKPVISVLNDLTSRPGVDRVNPQGLFCARGDCVISVDGKPAYFDDNHLSVTGARHLSKAFERFF